MRAARLAFVLSLALGGLAACSRPSLEDCRKAVLNLQRLRGLDTHPQAPDPEAWVRKCRATGNPENVRCLVAARTEAEADACQKK
jgi:hypothetical protein